MVAIAQLAERLFVAQKVVGSSPISHPKKARPIGRAFCFHQVLVGEAQLDSSAALEGSQSAPLERTGDHFLCCGRSAACATGQ